jgi:hypothetical protein
VTIQTFGQTMYTCDDIGESISVPNTLSDENGNMTFCIIGIQVQDETNPMATCQDITANLDENGLVSITPEQVNDGSTDNCEIESISLSEMDFACEDVGLHVVTLTVTDVNGNSSTCTSNVTVQDNTNPTAVCVTETITASLDENGMASITDEQIENGSTDNCGVQSTFASPTDFDCSNIGANTVTLTVTDVNGNTSTCTSTVEVVDELGPVGENCGQTFMLDLDETGMATYSQDLIGDVSDNCEGAVTIQTFGQTMYTCNDIGQTISVPNILRDDKGNSSFCIISIQVQDLISPEAMCQNTSVTIDATGQASITSSDIDNGSSDNCGTPTLSLSQTDFDCSDLENSPVSVTLTATDASGNVSTCTAMVTVGDNISPQGTNCGGTVTLNLDATGMVSFQDLDLGVITDNCPSSDVGIFYSGASQLDYTCSDLSSSPFIVDAFLRDKALNSTSCSVTVTLTDDDTVCPPALDGSPQNELSQDNSNIDLQIVQGKLKMTKAEAFPIPFNTMTNIAYHLSVPSKVSVKVYNTFGQEIKVLLSGKLPQTSGRHLVRWYPENDVVSGIYFIRIEVEGEAATILKVNRVNN